MKYYLFTLLISFLSLPIWAQNKPFFWADDQNYAPYIYTDKNGHKAGIFHDVMVAVFAKMEKPFNAKLYPWKRAQTLVSTGEADGMITIPTQKRLKFLVASDPIIQSEMKVHYNENNDESEQILAISTIAELKNYDLVDYLGDGWAESNLAEHNVIWAPNYTSAILMVAVNRGDIFLDDPTSIKFHIKKQIAVNPELTEILTSIKQGKHSIVSTPFCLLIRQDSPHVLMLEKFNAALQEIKRSGEYQKIIERNRH